MISQQEQSQGTLRKQRKPFVMSPIHLFCDASVTSEAKTLWVILESKPDGWKFYWSEILKHFKEGRDQIKNAMKELEVLGYVQKKNAKKGNLFCGMDIEVFYDPTLPFDVENIESARVTEIQEPENQQTDFQITERRQAEIKDIKEDLSKLDLSKTKLSLSEMENFWKELKEREKFNFEIDVKKFYDWCIDEDLKISWKNAMKTWASKERNQIKQSNKPANHNLSSLDSADEEANQKKQEQERLNSVKEFEFQWQEMLKKIENELGSDFKFFKSVKLHCVKKDQITLLAPSKFIRDWIKKEYLGKLKGLFRINFLIDYLGN